MRSTILIFICLFLVATSQARIIYVDANTPDNNDGSSWAKAYKFLQNALADANTSGDVNEICVAQGTYNPDANSSFPDGTGDREASFHLINGVALKGGYAGFGEPDPNARDVELYETILSGDLDGNDVDVNNPLELLTESTRGENSHHVVIGADTTSVLDGVTVTAGYTKSSLAINDWVGGGGIYGGTSTIRNCTISANSASDGTYSRGGGMLYCNGAIISCTIRENSAYGGGGGLSHCDGPIPDCFVSENSSKYYKGGGLYMCDGPITNCTISENSTNDYGGGLSNCNGSITNCVISGNSALFGGGMSYCNGPITNCTISGNYSRAGDHHYELSWCEAPITNSVIWGHRVSPYFSGTITYSDVQGGYLGEGNIAVDPCFADPCSGDYHLKSQAGRWDPNTQSWIQDANTSPCIDAGNPNSSIGWEPFPNGGVVNMGAYGGTEKASKSYFGTPVCEKPISGDINGDCIVDWRDFAIMAFHWLEDNNE